LILIKRLKEIIDTNRILETHADESVNLKIISSDASISLNL